MSLPLLALMDIVSPIIILEVGTSTGCIQAPRILDRHVGGARHTVLLEICYNVLHFHTVGPVKYPQRDIFPYHNSSGGF